MTKVRQASCVALYHRRSCYMLTHYTGVSLLRLSPIAEQVEFVSSTHDALVLLLLAVHVTKYPPPVALAAHAAAHVVPTVAFAVQLLLKPTLSGMVTFGAAVHFRTAAQERHKSVLHVCST